MSNFRIEFPDYPADQMPALPEGFTDRSWSNEPCPCFIHDWSGVVLWVDYPDADDREAGGDYSRFIVQRCTARAADGSWQFDGGMLTLFETDDWDIVLRSLPNFLSTVTETVRIEATGELAIGAYTLKPGSEPGFRVYAPIANSRSWTLKTRLPPSSWSSSNERAPPPFRPIVHL